VAKVLEQILKGLYFFLTVLERFENLEMLGMMECGVINFTFQGSDMKHGAKSSQEVHNRKTNTHTREKWTESTRL
jgi:hypothetical protein